MMTHEEHAAGVGGIITNLQTLETVIRIFLAALDDQKWKLPDSGQKEIDETWLTNFRAFGPLIRHYNDALTDEERGKFSVCTSHILVRDSFAHGRLFSIGDVFPATLYKFGIANNGKIPIEFRETLTIEWMGKIRTDLRNDHRRVAECFNGRNFNGARMQMP